VSLLHPDFAMDYVSGMSTLTEEPLQAIVRVLSDELPHAWLERYRRMCEGPTNVLEVPVQGFTYLFD